VVTCAISWRRTTHGLATGLLFSSEARTRPIGNDSLDDVWPEAQIKAEQQRTVTAAGKAAWTDLT
jgi:hypothetical protein